MTPDKSEAAHLHAFTVGDWLVEPRACHVSRGDSVVKLRPQLIDLLACLARRAGEIVLKDEILAEVWPGQYIAESGLSRCIAELRQILRDDAQQPRYIETITKRGYRLVAPVVWVAPADAAETPAKAEPHGVPVAEGVTPGTPAPGATPTRRPRWQGRAGWAAGGVLLVALGIGAVVMLRRAPAKALLTERDTVLLADVNNTTHEPVFDDTLRLALAVNLDQAPFLHILPDDVGHAAMSRMGRSPDEPVVGPRALDVCRREGAAVLLAGSIAPLGSRYALGIEAIACASGESLGRALAEADRKERVLAALNQAATRIREKLGESRESLGQHGVPLERATTPSLDALKALTVGDEHRDHARLPEALALYRQATEIDPGFALAWARRGAAASNLLLGDEMISAFRRAYELRERVSRPEQFYIEGHYYRHVEGNPEKAIQIYETWKAMYPGSVIPPNNLAALLSGTMGLYDAALVEAREAVRLAPGSSIAYRNLVRAHLGAGRIEDARLAIAAAGQRGIDDALMHRLLWNMALFDGDRPALDRETRWASRDPMAALVTLRLRASEAMAAGRLRDARRVWSEAAAKASEIGPASRVAEIRLYQAEAEALLGDRQAARDAVEAALAADRYPVTLANAVIALALSGDTVRARAILAEMDRRPVQDAGPLIVALPSARALVEAVHGRGDNAMGILQPIARFSRGSDFALVPLGVTGVVELHARRPSDAAATFGDLIQLRAIEPASPWVAFARLGLARALRDSGNRSGSLAAYDGFLESWKGADAGAPLFEVVRRERAAVARH